MPQLAEPPTLTLRYENSSPVELADLTSSLQAVARRFSRHVGQAGTDVDEDSVKLYVRRISAGSIVVDLVNVLSENKESLLLGAVVTGTAVTNSNAIVTFSKNLRDGLNYLVGRGPKKIDLPASELKDLAKIVEPVAKDGDGTFHISATDGASVQVSITYNSLEANTIQNRAERELSDRREPAQTSYRRVLMYWYQASITMTSKSDKAVIEKISDKALKVIFADDSDIKSKMLSGKNNPFNIGFLVDVELITKQGRPVAYEVKHLYEILNDDPDEPT